eukprot:TRINITY_DN30055_c0_g1_i1.p1 TRINITY_DN30055_c0_g1~~TRINITY_DN30055_c0_g1_i1.p1  ORF type:complete len:314 (+),score=76.15 TRINITY_DN30055_c0_g1_i1:270-1211(+)
MGSGLACPQRAVKLQEDVRDTLDDVAGRAWQPFAQLLWRCRSAPERARRQAKALHDLLGGEEVQHAMAAAGIRREQAVRGLLESSFALATFRRQKEALLEVLESRELQTLLSTGGIGGDLAIKALLDTSPCSARDIIELAKALDPDWERRRALLEVLSDEVSAALLGRSHLSKELAARAALCSSLARESLQLQSAALREVLEEGNILIVMQNANVDGEAALRALLDASGDIVDALKVLDPASWTLEGETPRLSAWSHLRARSQAPPKAAPEHRHAQALPTLVPQAASQMMPPQAEECVRSGAKGTRRRPPKSS